MTEQELQALAQKVQERRSEERTLEVKAAHSGYPQKLYGTLSAFSDIRTVPQAATETIQGEALKGYIAKASRDNPNLARLRPEEKRALLSLTRSGVPTLTCILLFSLYPQAFFPQYTIQATVVPGDTMGEVDVDGARFTDNRRIEGTLPEMLERALDFCRKNMGLRTVVDPGTGERKDRTDYPIVALREAILNALIHRDYSLHTQGIPIGMTFYRDRWELRSPGGLYGRLTIDEIGKVQPDTRNPILARAMETLSLVENRYSGIPTIRRELREASLREPVFRSIRGEFQVVFFKTPETPGTEVAANTQRETGLIPFCSIPRSREEIAQYLGLKSWHYVKNFYLDPLLASGVLRMTIPEKPRSRKQKYYSARNST